MKINLRAWAKDLFRQAINSIAFYPAIIALAFLTLSFLSIEFDFSEQGKHIKSQIGWLHLKDASTARSIISSITAGIISLTVFSFSMVMIVLNQTASQMSNRILDKLIGSRFQQVVLGVYVGTIVYALFLLSTIRDVDNGVHVPAISTYFLIMLTVFDIFLFIYFLHYITQSVKYEVIIRRIYDETLQSMKRSCCLEHPSSSEIASDSMHPILASVSGIYQGFDHHDLIPLCEKNDCTIMILHTPGSFVLKGLPVASVSVVLSEEEMSNIASLFYLYTVESIEENFFYGFHQLAEVAIKALSPGINDPATAIASLRALFQLFAFRISLFPEQVFRDGNGKVRVVAKELTFGKIFNETIGPVWEYGKRDQWVRAELKDLINQLRQVGEDVALERLLQSIQAEQTMAGELSNAF